MMLSRKKEGERERESEGEKREKKRKQLENLELASFGAKFHICTGPGEVTSPAGLRAEEWITIGTHSPW